MNSGGHHWSAVYYSNYVANLSTFRSLKVSEYALAQWVQEGIEFKFKEAAFNFK